VVDQARLLDVVAGAELADTGKEAV
jgi:hypothetical protein